MGKTVIIALVIIAALFALRFPLLNVPLERDEGEYAYIAQNMGQGLVPYKDVFDQKPPLIFAIYWLALFLFGQSIASIHFVLFIFIAAGAIFLFLIGKRISGNGVGIVSSLVFGFLSSCMAFQASSANTEHFMNTAVIISFFLFVIYIENERPVLLFLSGLAAGIAFMVKQPAVVQLCFLVAAVSIRAIMERKGLAFLVLHNLILFLSFALPIIGLAAIFALYGALNDLIFCAYKYNVGYSSMASIKTGITAFQITFKDIFFACWTILFMPVIAFIFREKKDKVPLLLAWLLFAFLGSSIGMIFRQHYFLQIVPPLALLFAFGAERLHKRIRVNIPGGYYILSFLICIPLVINVGSNYSMSPSMLSKTYFGYMNPFTESVKVGAFIAKNSTSDDKILVIGSEPQIYFYSKRQAVTKYIYFYQFFLKSNFAAEMQKEAIEDIRRASPLYIIFINERFSFLITKNSEIRILEELNDIVTSQYHPVACVTVSDNFSSAYYSEERFAAVKNNFPDINNITLNVNKPKITIFKRN